MRTDYRMQYEGETIDKHALVYLPPGCDQQGETRYDIVYLMHVPARLPTACPAAPASRQPWPPT